MNETSEIITTEFHDKIRIALWDTQKDEVYSKLQHIIWVRVMGKVWDIDRANLRNSLFIDMQSRVRVVE